MVHGNTLLVHASIAYQFVSTCPGDSCAVVLAANLTEKRFCDGNTAVNEYVLTLLANTRLNWQDFRRKGLIQTMVFWKGHCEQPTSVLKRRISKQRRGLKHCMHSV